MSRELLARQAMYSRLWWIYKRTTHLCYYFDYDQYWVPERLSIRYARKHDFRLMPEHPIPPKPKAPTNVAQWPLV